MDTGQHLPCYDTNTPPVVLDIRQQSRIFAHVGGENEVDKPKIVELPVELAFGIGIVLILNLGISPTKFKIQQIAVKNLWLQDPKKAGNVYRQVYKKGARIQG